MFFCCEWKAICGKFAESQVCKTLFNPGVDCRWHYFWISVDELKLPEFGVHLGHKMECNNISFAKVRLHLKTGL